VSVFAKWISAIPELTFKYFCSRNLSRHDSLPTMLDASRLPLRDSSPKAWIKVKFQDWYLTVKAESQHLKVKPMAVVPTCVHAPNPKTHSQGVWSRVAGKNQNHQKWDSPRYSSNSAGSLSGFGQKKQNHSACQELTVQIKKRIPSGIFLGAFSWVTFIDRCSSRIEGIKLSLANPPMGLKVEARVFDKSWLPGGKTHAARSKK